MAIWLEILSLLHSRGFVTLILSLALLVISASFLFESTNSWVYWLYDDTDWLSTAYNLFHGKGLFRDFIDYGATSVEYNVQQLMSYDQISNPLRSKPPLYLVLLGGWLFITGANYTNWFFWGSIFNFILSAISIVLFYFFTKRHFGIEIASYATPVLAVMPLLIWFSVRIRTEVLTFILIIIAFYFAARKITYKNIILLGLLSGMAHLSHPIGLMLVSGLAVYLLLFKRKFKGTAVLLATWASVILPWMVRNYIVFGDATQGLALPIPRGVSIALGLISPTGSRLSGTDLGHLAGIPLNDTIIGMLNEFAQLYGMQFFILFVACSVAAYLSFPALKRALSSSYTCILLILSVAIYIGVIRWAVFFNNVILQFFVFFLIPLIVYLGIRFFSQHKDIFTTEGKDIYAMLAIFVIISFVPYLMLAQIIDRVVPEVRYIAFSLFMLIPLAIIGIKKLLEVIYASFIGSPSIRIKIVSLSIFSILVLFSSIQVLTGIPSLIAYLTPFAESEEMRNIHEWIIENVPLDSKIASNKPHAILLRTGQESVNFPSAYIDNSLYERWIVKKFDIDYLVFYGTIDVPAILGSKDLGNIELRPVYRSEGGVIYKAIAK